jgi:hypothetical protein
MGVCGVVGYVIDSLPIDASDEGTHLRQNILELCPMGQLEQLRPRALDQFSWALRSRFTQRGNIDDFDEGRISLNFFRTSGCSFGDTIIGNFTARSCLHRRFVISRLPVDATSCSRTR